MEFTYLADSKAADIAYMEFCDSLAYTEDIGILEEFMEDGERKNVIQVILDKLKSLAEKIISAISNAVKSVKFKNTKKVAEQMVKHPKLHNAKVKIMDVKKRFSLADQYKEKIKNAKNEQEVQKLQDEYEKKRKHLIAGTTAAVATVSVVSLISWLGKNPEEKEIKKEYKEAVELCKKFEKENPDVKGKKLSYKEFKKMNNLTQTNVGAIRSTLANVKARGISKVVGDKMRDCQYSFRSGMGALTSFVHGVGKKGGKKADDGEITKNKPGLLTGRDLSQLAYQATVSSIPDGLQKPSYEDWVKMNTPKK